MSIAALVETLLSAGVDHATIVAAVKAVEPSVSVPARSSAAERQARYRERKASQSVTVTSQASQSVTQKEGSQTLQEKNPTIPKNTPKGVQKGVSPRSFDPRKALADLGCEEKHITGWLEVRKAKRAPLTEAALDSLKREADRANISVAYAVQVCAAKGWQSFDANWKFERPPPDANATAGPKLVFVIEGSEQWQAWCDYRRKIGANRPFVTENRENGFKRGNWFPTEYPPKEGLRV